LVAEVQQDHWLLETTTVQTEQILLLIQVMSQWVAEEEELELEDQEVIPGEMVDQVVEHTTGRYLAEDIRHSCEQRDMQLWLILTDSQLRGILVTEVLVYPRKKALRVVMIGGEGLDEWNAEMDRTLEAFARHEGCSLIDAHGRKGWARKIAPFGYRQTAAEYERSLT
jgi:hypothetical protein